MNQLKRASEARLGELKSEMGTKEEEVEEMRYKLSVGGHLTREYHEKNRTLQEEQLSLRRVTERTESAEQLEQEVVSGRSEEHTSELQSLMRISYAVFCLKKKKKEETE